MFTMVAFTFAYYYYYYFKKNNSDLCCKQLKAF